jgi:hypothetical protein
MPQRICMRGARSAWPTPTEPCAQDEGLVGAAGQPGDDLGDPGWGWGGAVRLGAGRFELRRPSSSAVVDLASFARRGSVRSGRPKRQGKARQGRPHSLPLLTYHAPGGLRQDPGRAAESSAGPRTDEDLGARRACVVVDGRGTRRRTAGGTGGAVAGARRGGAGVRAARLGGAAGRLVRGRQREMRTCRTSGLTLRETPVIRPVGAVQRSTAASEVSR